MNHFVVILIKMNRNKMLITLKSFVKVNRFQNLLNILLKKANMMFNLKKALLACLLYQLGKN